MLKSLKLTKICSFEIMVYVATGADVRWRCVDKFTTEQNVNLTTRAFFPGLLGQIFTICVYNHSEIKYTFLRKV